MFRRQWREREAVTDPHGRLPRSRLISVFKLLYWWTDCWWGYLVTIRLARGRSGLVIFDRYLDDILIDPWRYRLPKSCLRLARLLVRLAPRPDICILLDVPSEVLQQRKAEVLHAESQRQRLEYLDMFRRLPEAFTVNASVPVSEVAEQVKALILAFPAGRSVNRAEVSLLADF